jgi:hypothetical protein
MGRQREIFVEEVTDDFLKSVADILGCASAAAQALAERDRRRDAGEDAVVLWERDRGILFVGPRPEAPT